MSGISSGLTDHLKRIHGAYNDDGFSFQNVKQPMTAQLITSGHLLADAGFVDPTNPAKVAVTLSQAGLEAAGVASPAEAGEPSDDAGEEVPAFAQEPAQAKPGRGAKRGPRVQPVIMAGTGFRFTDIPTPVKGERAKGARPETYKFSTLAEPDDNGYDSFFVAATADMPNPGKTLNGTVTSANKRFKDKGIAFKLVPMEHDPEHRVKGARVLRIS